MLQLSKYFHDHRSAIKTTIESNEKEIFYVTSAISSVTCSDRDLLLRRDIMMRPDNNVRAEYTSKPSVAWGEKSASSSNSQLLEMYFSNEAREWDIFGGTLPTLYCVSKMRRCKDKE
ncbi:hypothetical protein NPIL_267131 [Nephila pilipes]|uniref:Uncharacterized protein n=1 Tax=Nephila pilipes TaxID=299642 RepID=A0A8X6Q1H0_NEPPI|nr:hypothetical protein NPIL_267131 [Nephila pilipes]